MAKKRKFCAYRALERPFTRFSKFKKMSFVKARPVNRIVRYDMGSSKKKFPFSLKLIAGSSLQIRDNALESARLTSNRLLEESAGKNNYRMRVMLYPHHILRENPLAAGAGADRMSTGMKKSFGKTIGVAAQIRKGSPIFAVDVGKNNLETARKALKRASYKLPCQCSIEITERKAEAKA
jgi:large subunit ribosomal protein L10e